MIAIPCKPRKSVGDDDATVTIVVVGA